MIILTCRRTIIQSKWNQGYLLVFRNHLHYQTEKHMKIIFFKMFSHTKYVKVLKDKCRESLTMATLHHQVLLSLSTGPCPIRHCFCKMSRDWERTKTNLIWIFPIEHIGNYYFAQQEPNHHYTEEKLELAERFFNQPGKEQKLHLSEGIIVFLRYGILRLLESKMSIDKIFCFLISSHSVHKMTRLENNL